jgi:Phage integrase family
VFTTQHGRPIEPRYLNTHFDRIRTAVGLPTVRLHDFRHTAVSLLLELGTPPHVVQAIARHADLDITMRIYAHTNLDSMREAVDKIDWVRPDRPLLHHCYIPADHPRTRRCGYNQNRRSAQRKRRDSNPRPVSGLSLSRRVHSAALPRFRRAA